MSEQLEQALIEVYDKVLQKYPLEELEAAPNLEFKISLHLTDKDIFLGRKEIQNFLHRTNRYIYPVNGEYLSQTNKDVFDLARASLPFAIYLLNHALEIQEKYIINQAFEFVGTYADWQRIPLDRGIKRALYVRNYGEEVRAMEESGEITY